MTFIETNVNSLTPAPLLSVVWSVRKHRKKVCERQYLHLGFVSTLLRSGKKQVTNYLCQEENNLVLKMLSKGLQLKGKATVELTMSNAFGDNTSDTSGP